MGETCGTHQGMKNSYSAKITKPEGNRPFGKLGIDGNKTHIATGCYHNNEP